MLTRAIVSTISSYWSCICSASIAVKVPMVDPGLRIRYCSVGLRHLVAIWPFIGGWFRLVAMGKFFERPSISPRGQKLWVVT